MTSPTLLRVFFEQLTSRSASTFMIVGSVAALAHGRARATQDIDIVVGGRRGAALAKALVVSLPVPSASTPTPQAAADAHRRSTLFNVDRSSRLAGSSTSSRSSRGPSRGGSSSRRATRSRFSASTAPGRHGRGHHRREARVVEDGRRFRAATRGRARARSARRAPGSTAGTSWRRSPSSGSAKNGPRLARSVERRSAELDLVVLDHGVREHLVGHLGEALLELGPALARPGRARSR